MKTPANNRQRQQTERLLNLLIALRAARGWVSRSTLMNVIAGYDGLDDTAFDRKFSRDKELLRAMGIRIATRAPQDSYGEDGDTGYRISADDYAMGDVDLTPAEAAAVTAAARFWAETEQGDNVSQALTKLRGTGVDLATSGTGLPSLVQGPAVRTLGSAVFATALRHTNAGEAITFDYHKPGQKPRRVRLEPYALLSRGARVYLIGHDLDRDSQRTFRLSRIAGGIGRLNGRTPGDFDIPADFTPTLSLHSSPEMAVVTEARLQVAPHRADPLRRRAIRTEPVAANGAAERRGDILVVEFADTAQFAAEIVGFGASVAALSPPSLVTAVTDRRETIAAALRRLGGRHALSA